MDLIRESSLFQHLTQQSREEAREQGGRERAIEDLLDVLEIRLISARQTLYLLALPPSMTCNASSSCSARRSRCPVLMNLDAGYIQRRDAIPQ